MTETSTPPAVTARAKPPSPKLALIVVGIAALVLLFGALASLFTGGGGSTPSSPVDTTVKTSSGLTVHEVPATKALGGIETAGEPPSDILSDLAIPTGSSSVSVIDNDSSDGYDRTERFTVGLTQADVISFFQDVLHDNGWTIVSNASPTTVAGGGPVSTVAGGGPVSTVAGGGPVSTVAGGGAVAGPTPAIEILATHGSEDGYYWELGVDASSTTFSAASTTSGSTTSGSTTSGSTTSGQPAGIASPAPGTSGQSTPFSVRLYEISDAD